MREKYKIPLNDGDIGTEGALVVSYPRTFSEADTYLAEVGRALVRAL